ncbi:Uncharacterized protein TCM_016118 [Theobroma cacao]|uniref:Uncharacterized protein n=1 Tax=Theobroma cacao TaxID=3641 RepID=A0A061G4P9_THECC|nr:Uncharacterized protein TCM_016118 [Theobroma cacao]
MNQVRVHLLQLENDKIALKGNVFPVLFNAEASIQLPWCSLLRKDDIGLLITFGGCWNIILGVASFKFIVLVERQDLENKSSTAVVYATYGLSRSSWVSVEALDKAIPTTQGSA